MCELSRRGGGRKRDEDAGGGDKRQEWYVDIQFYKTVDSKKIKRSMRVQMTRYKEYVMHYIQIIFSAS